MPTNSLNIKVPRLGVNRFGVYYVRSSSPDVVNGRRKVTQQSLGTKDPLLAKVLALKFCLSLLSEDLVSKFRDQIGRYELDLATGKAKADGPEDHARMMQAIEGMASVMRLQTKLQPQSLTIAAPAPTPSLSPEAAELVQLASQVIGASLPSLPKPSNVGTKLRVALDNHLAEEAKRLKVQTTVAEKRVLFQEFSDFFGDLYLNQITKDDFSERWRKAEFKRPNKKREGETLSLARLEKRRGYLAKFFDWAIENGSYFHANPAKQAMATKAEIRSHQTPWAEFNADDLKLLFSADYKVRMQQADWYWLPLVALYSGARLSEIAALRLDDIREIEGIRVMSIKDAKTPSGIRTVPIHSSLLALGLWDYVENLRANGFDRFLPHRPEKMAGRIWGKWVSECGIKDDAKVFHSFRSTAITDMHNADANHAGIHRAVGHATAGVKGTHGKYVRGIQLGRLQETIEKLHYPSVDLGLIKRDDPCFNIVVQALKCKATDPKELARAERLARHADAKQAREARLAKQPARAPIILAKRQDVV
jgi:integrase